MFRHVFARTTQQAFPRSAILTFISGQISCTGSGFLAAAAALIAASCSGVIPAIGPAAAPGCDGDIEAARAALAAARAGDSWSTEVAAAGAAWVFILRPPSESSSALFASPLLAWKDREELEVSIWQRTLDAFFLP